MVFFCLFVFLPSSDGFQKLFLGIQQRNYYSPSVLVPAQFLIFCHDRVFVKSDLRLAPEELCLFPFFFIANQLHGGVTIWGLLSNRNNLMFARLPSEMLRVSMQGVERSGWFIINDQNQFDVQVTRVCPGPLSESKNLGDEEHRDQLITLELNYKGSLFSFISWAFIFNHYVKLFSHGVKL